MKLSAAEREEKELAEALAASQASNEEEKKIQAKNERRAKHQAKAKELAQEQNA